MFYNIIMLSFFCSKRSLLILFQIILLSAFSFSVEFPDSLSQNSTISIVEVNYTGSLRKYFSKYCIRIFDSDTGFDKTIDFSSFDDFDDNLFPIKFFLSGGSKKAFIKAFSFYDFFMHEKSHNLSKVSEYSINFSYEEISYIYSFIATLNKKIPNYSYDFDIKNNNSKTFISNILSDRYLESYITNDRSFSISKRTLLSPQSQHLSILKFSFIKKSAVLSLSVYFLCAIIVIITTYQLLVLFSILSYHSSVFYFSEFFDFCLFFVSGLTGCFFLFQFLFSDQIILKQSHLFLTYNPLNTILSFLIFAQSGKEKIKFLYFWSISIFLMIISLLLKVLILKDYSLNSILIFTAFIIRYVWYLLDAIWQQRLKTKGLSA